MKELQSLAINENGFTFDPASGESFRLNHTALFMVKKIKNGHDDKDIAAIVSDSYGISFEEALADVLDLKMQFRLCGVLKS